MARKHRRRNSRRYRRNPSSMLRLFNPFSAGGVVAKITSSAKEVAAVSNLKKSGVIVGTILLGFTGPSKFLPRYAGGVSGALLTAGFGILATAAAALGAPALAPAAATGAAAAFLLKLGLMYAHNWFSLGGFLTRQQLGQIPSGILAPGQLLNGFLTTKEPYQAMGPMSSRTIGGMSGERFSNVV